MGPFLAFAGAAIGVLALVLAMAHDRAVARSAKLRPPTPVAVPQDSDELWLESFCRAQAIARPSNGVPVQVAEHGSQAASEPTKVDALAYADTDFFPVPALPALPMRARTVRGDLLALRAPSTMNDGLTPTRAYALRAATPSY